MLDEVASGGFAVAARRWARPFRDSFPDFTMQITALAADGGKLAGAFGVEDNVGRMHHLGLST